ncbi:MAG: response regulator [Myxococcota bacterium]
MKPTVLVVDDDPLFLESVRRQLQDQFTVLVSRDPAATLEHSAHFDVVMADFFMPAMNGADYLAAVRVKHPDAMRVLITGGADLEIGVEAVNKAAVHALLQKPVSAEVLRRTLIGTLTPLPQPAASRRTPVPQPPPTTATAAPRSGRSVLIIDDSEISLEATQTKLEGAGFQVKTLLDPFQLIRTLREEQPDVILLDVNMPALDGPKLLEAMRGYDFLKQTRVFLHSSMPPRELERECKRCRADGWLSKGDPKLIERLEAMLAAPRPS